VNELLTCGILYHPKLLILTVLAILEEQFKYSIFFKNFEVYCTPILNFIKGNRHFVFESLVILLDMCILAAMRVCVCVCVCARARVNKALNRPVVKRM
jgi:hypothetical protein